MWTSTHCCALCLAKRHQPGPQMGALPLARLSVCVCGLGGIPPKGTNLGYLPLTSAFHSPRHARGYLFILIFTNGETEAQWSRHFSGSPSQKGASGIGSPNSKSCVCVFIFLSLWLCMCEDLTITHSFLYLLTHSFIV